MLKLVNSLDNIIYSEEVLNTFYPSNILNHRYNIKWGGKKEEENAD